MGMLAAGLLALVLATGMLGGTTLPRNGGSA
jgi:hypothetical protein